MTVANRTRAPNDVQTYTCRSASGGSARAPDNLDSYDP